MSATVEERARRRLIDNQKRGIESSIEKLQEEIALRDKMDSEREASPLIQAEDAIFLDTTSLSIDDAAQAILRLAQEKNGINPKISDIFLNLKDLFLSLSSISNKIVREDAKEGYICLKK